MGSFKQFIIERTGVPDESLLREDDVIDAYIQAVENGMQADLEYDLVTIPFIDVIAAARQKRPELFEESADDKTANNSDTPV